MRSVVKYGLFSFVFVMALIFGIIIEASFTGYWSGVNARHESTKLELIANFDGVLVYADRMGGYEVRP